eukprot:gene477-6887_t
MNKQLVVLILLIITFASAENNVTKNKKGLLCGTCTTTIGLVKEFLAQSNEEWQNLVNNGCLLLPDAIKQPCRMTSLILLPEALRYLRSVFKDDSKIICGRIGLCKVNKYHNNANLNKYKLLTGQETLLK